MDTKTKRALFQAVKKRYHASNRQEKRMILDELTATTGCHRKSIVRRLNATPALAPVVSVERRGRPSVVTDGDLAVLKRVAPAMNWACGKRMVAMLPEWLDHYEGHLGLFEPGQQDRLISLSAATLDRHLASPRRQAGIRGRTGTRPGTWLKTQIPIRQGVWNETEPGFLEADTVAHCGGSMSGAFVWSLTMTDIASAWTECSAVWHKQVTGIRDQISFIDTVMPFTIKGFDVDNGSEFINHTLAKYFLEHYDDLQFTRSRPGKKNDNAHVEQKNYSHVRKLMGYKRIDNKAAVDAMNDLYQNEVSWLNNLFMVNRKLIRSESTGSKRRRFYDDPKTPINRLQQLDAGDPNRIRDLIQRKNALSPFELARIIDIKKKGIMDLLR